MLARGFPACNECLRPRSDADGVHKREKAPGSSGPSALSRKGMDRS